MSGTSSAYSHADTGSKPADPYKETNLDHASLKERVEGLIQFIESHKFCLMTTRQKDTGHLVSRCMAVAALEGINLLFHTNTESGKTDELVGDPHVNIGFLKESTGDWASVSGTAEIISDRELVKKYYSNRLKAWVGDLGDGVHDGGPNDPRVGVIKIHVRTATYSLAQGNAITRGIEVAKGTITGKPAHVNQLRELTEGDLDTYRKSQNLVS
ncbi:bli-3 protein [Tirmania nivea]|nr:bli-3 protein [Tirmania nivea]